MPEFLQSELQAIAPLAQACLRLGEHPWHAFDPRKIDLAGIAMDVVALFLEWRLVTARTGEQVN